MDISVRLLGNLRRHAPTGSLQIEVQEGTTVAKVIELLGLRPGDVWLAKLGDQLVDMNHPLRGGGDLLLIPPIGGGN